MRALPPLQIESLAHGGDGVATLPSGKKVFVPATAPGDRVEAAVVEEKDALVRARLLRVIEPGPARTAPACPHAARCGGCQLQHLAIEAQRAAKERAFYDALERIGGIPRASIADARPLLASPAPLRYRARCRLAVRGGSVGYLRRGSHELEPISTCHLLEPALERLALAVVAALRARPLPHLRAIELCVGADGAGAAALEPDADAPARWAEAAPRIFRDVEGLRGVIALAPPGRGPKGRRPAPAGTRPPPAIFGDPVVERAAPLAPGVRLLHRPDAFAQANAAANEALVRAAVEGLDLVSGAEVLELYAGAGNFTFALAARGAKVTAVEREGASLALARRAAEAAGIESVRFVAADAALAARDFAQAGRRFDAVLLDPPRAGAKGIAAAIAALRPARVAWVSCEPAAMARDLSDLVRAGHRVVRTVPVDMFPQTFHVEAVALLAPARR